MERDRGCQQEREKEKNKTQERGMQRRMRMEWEEWGALGSFHTPIDSAKTRGLACPRGGRGGKTGLVQGSVSCVQAYGSNRDASLGVFCALR